VHAKFGGDVQCIVAAAHADKASLSRRTDRPADHPASDRHCSTKAACVAIIDVTSTAETAAAQVGIAKRGALSPAVPEGGATEKCGGGIKG